MGLLDRLDLKVQQEVLDLLVLKDLPAVSDPKARKDLLAQQVRRGQQVVLDHKDHKGQPDLPGLKATRDHRVLQALLVRPARKAHKD